MSDSDRVNGSRPTVKFAELSSEAIYALFYALATVDPQQWQAKFKQMDRLADERAIGQGMYVFSPSAKRELIRRGLHQLWERELIEVAKDGLGEALPVAVHLDRLDMVGREFILAERS